MSRLGVAWNGDVNVLDGRVSVAECNDWDVDIRCLGDGLVIRDGIGDDQETWLTESLLGLIGECTGCEAASNWCGADVVRELENGTLTEWAR